MKLKLLLLLLGTSWLSMAQTYTYSNGAFTTGTVTKSGVAAPTVPSQHQWSECQNDTGNTTQTNFYTGFKGYYNNSNINISIADDFKIPFSESWGITSIDFFCFQQDYLGSTSPISELKVKIWSGFPNVPTSTVVAGNFTTNVIDLASSEDTYTLRINNTEVPSPGVPPVDTRRVWKIRANISANLGAGIYWIEVQGKAVNNQEFRFVPTTTIGSRGNGNAAQFILTSNTVQALADTGYPNSSPDVTQDLAFSINYSDPLSTNETVLASKVHLYPNPVEDILTIGYDSENPLRYNIIDITGKIVKKDETSKSINLSTLNSGVYMICFNLEGKKVFKKIIKK